MKLVFVVEVEADHSIRETVKRIWDELARADYGRARVSRVTYEEAAKVVALARGAE
jgi:hypothetical protein